MATPEVAQPRPGGIAEPSGEQPVGRFAGLDAFRAPAFRFLWLSSFNFALVQGIQRFTFVWLVLDLRDGSGAAGLVAFALGIPVFFIALPAGLLSDRMDRRILLQGSVIGAFVVSVATAVFVISGAVTVPITFALALLLGTTLAFGQPVRAAILPSIVERSRLMNAVVLMSLGQNIAMVAGPALGGAAIAIWGIGGAFAVQAVLYALSYVAILPLRIPAHAAVKGARNLRRDLGEGFSFVWKNPPIRTLVFLLLVGSFFLMGSSSVLVPRIAKEELGQGAFASSLLFGFLGLGMLFSSLFLASQTRMPGKGMWFMVALTLAGVIYVAMGLSPWYWLLAVLHVVWGLTGGFYTNLNQTLIQGATPAQLMGRVMAVHSLVFLGIGPLGSLAAGPAADWMGAREYVMLCGVVTTLVAGWMLLQVRTLRHMS